ncbi:MAG: PHP domain-containing protein [Candidatus Methanomethylophilaceae archaeon]|nr:PHP domain-containing protein [Candidatus Methanomethylophilaceae archaeon]
MEVKHCKPNHKALENQGKMAVDMHFHTNCSDSFTDVDKLMKLAQARRTGVAITDHNLIKSLQKIQGKEYTVPVIPGMEVSTSDGPHILVYFYDFKDLESFWTRNIRPQLNYCPWLALKHCTTENLLDLLEKENCVVSGAHPMGYLMSNKGVEVCINKKYLEPEIATRLDAYEVICSGMTRRSNQYAYEAAMKYGIGFTGGTDGHLMTEVGNVVTISSAKDIGGFLDSIKEHKVDICGLEKSVPRKVQMGSASMVRFIQHAPSATAVQTIQTAKSFRRAFRRRSHICPEKNHDIFVANFWNIPRDAYFSWEYSVQ